MTVPDLSTREGREQMRKIARDATPGPWVCTLTGVHQDFSAASQVSETSYEGIGVVPEEYVRDEDADHIATFDPPTVTALLDALDAAEARSIKNGKALCAARNRADRAEATLRHVQEVLPAAVAAHLYELYGSLTTPCGRGPCDLGDGHTGPCRM